MDSDHRQSFTCQARTNKKDSNAVAVLKEDSIVGHVPRNLSPRLFHFLRRDVNNAFAEVTGQKVNRGAGYGLEIPCTIACTVHLLI